jgi:hypothetical protein
MRDATIAYSFMDQDSIIFVSLELPGKWPVYQEENETVSA